MAVNCRLLPKGIESGDGVIAIETRVGDTPVPLSDTCCGLFDALSLKLSVPDLVPAAFGEKTTEEVQLEPPASVLGLSGQVEVTTKSLTLVVIPAIVRGNVRLSVSVTDWDPLVVPLT